MSAPPPTAPLPRADAAALLAWYAESGIDLALDEGAHDRFADSRAALAAPREKPELVRGASSPAPEAKAAQPAAMVRPAAQHVAPDDAAMEAQVLARAATTLEALRAALEAFNGCALKTTAKHCCFADGVPGARVMLVGEAPGADEDRVGLPFVGRSGQLLDRMLAAIGLSRESNVYIANTVPWRPPGNRTPTPQEMASCAPFIQRQIELANPDILICVGGPSAQSLLGTKEGITRTRGKWFDYDTGTRVIRAMPIFHPAFLLRSPLQKRYAWRDLREIKAALNAGEAAHT